MRFLKPLISAAAVAAMFATAPAAFAQRNSAATVVVFNYQRLLAESTAGRGIQTALQGIGATISAEAQALAPEAQSLQQEQQRLEGVTRNMSQEQLRNNSDVQAYAQRAQQFQTRRQALEGDFECTRVLTLRAFDQQISPVVRQVMEAHNAGVVLDIGSTQMHAPQFDVTDEIMQRVNSTVPSVNVARHPYTECQPQQAPAQQ